MEKRYLIVLKIILLFSVLYITYYRINNKKYIENNKTSIIGIVRSVKDNKIVINNYQVICKDKTNIILMHDSYETTVEAVRQVLPLLYEEGYQVVSVSELAALKGQTLEKNNIYRHF